MNNKLAEITEFILSRDNFLILTHERPDGDAVGSVSAMQFALMSVGKNSEIFFGDPLQEKHVKYLNNNIWFSKPEEAKLQHSCAICLDSGTADRISISDKEILKKLPVINMDHHPDNTYFGTVNFVNPQACATAEIIFDLLRHSPGKWKITTAAASSILLGILMDTGGLRFDNTTNVTLEKTGELISYGADYHRLVKDLYLSKPLKMAQLESDIILNYLKLEFEGRFAYCRIDDALLDKYGIALKDTDGLIDILRSIKGVVVSALISKGRKGYKISLRSNSTDYPVNRVAQKYSGGGHVLASGCHIDTDDASEVEKIISREARELLNA